MSAQFLFAVIFTVYISVLASDYSDLDYDYFEPIFSTTKRTETEVEDLGQPETFAVAYEDAKFEGGSIQLLPRRWKGCHVLEAGWQNRISSVDVISGCVDLCQDTACEGPCRKICSGIRGESNLTLINYDDSVSSFQKCTCPYDKLRNRFHKYSL